MPLYTIDQISKISGLSKLLIRTWENRYNLFSPERTQTNIRLYSNENLVKALNVKLLKEKGYKISKISLLSRDEIIEIVNSMTDNDALFETKQIHALIESGLTFNERLFNQVFEESLENNEIIHVYKNIILPALNKIGFLWLTTNISASQEHFLSQLIKKKIYASIDVLNKNLTSDAECWLLFLPDGEYHEIGLLIAHLILSQNNKRVLNLGPSLPVDSLDVLSTYYSIDKILFFVVTRNSVARLNDTIIYLKSCFKKAQIYCVAHSKEVNIDDQDNVTLINTIEQFQAILI